jgi:hypothetical protein
MGHRLLLLLAWILLWPGIAAADGFSIDRTLRREPAYSARPQYCLLLLGPEGKTRIWLVAAGEAFYVDTNGDGDLTKPGKRVYSIGNYRSLVYIEPFTQFMWFPVPENERVYNVGDVFDGATWHHLTVNRLGKLKTAVFEIVVDIRGKFRQIGALPRFGDTPKEAPVLHFGGPLTLGLFTSQLVRGPTPNYVDAWIGTKPPAGAKGEPTYLVLNDWIPSYIAPIARMEFPNRTGEGNPIRSTVRLARREALVRSWARTLVPDGAGAGRAKIKLTIPNWNGPTVQPFATDIPLVDHFRHADSPDSTAQSLPK